MKSSSSKNLFKNSHLENLQFIGLQNYFLVHCCETPRFPAIFLDSWAKNWIGPITNCFGNKIHCIHICKIFWERVLILYLKTQLLQLREIQLLNVFTKQIDTVYQIIVG